MYIYVIYIYREREIDNKYSIQKIKHIHFNMFCLKTFLVKSNLFIRYISLLY